VSSNIEIRITADVVELQAKFAVARAESSALTAELNKLARQAATGGMTDQLKAQLTQAAEGMLQAKARTAELSAELKNSQGSVSGFSGAVSTAEQTLGAFGGALSAASIVAFAKSVLEAGAAIQREADALQISVETLQAFQYLSRETGVDVDTSTTALKRFIANLGQLQETGTGKTVDDLREMGLTADELAGDPVQALITFARAWDKVADATRQAAIERDFFGRSGVDLSALLHKLAEGAGDTSDKIKELTDNARAAGQMMDGEATKGALKFDEALEGLAIRAKAGVAGLIELIWQQHQYSEAVQESIRLTDALGKRELLPAARPGPQGMPAPPTPSMEKPTGYTGRQVNDISDLPGHFTIESEQQIAAAAAKAAEAARKASDEVTSAWVQSNLKRIQNEQQTNSFLLDMGQQSVDEFIAKARDLENERYSVALAGLRRREAADAGNKVALAKDMADEQILAQDHADKLSDIDRDLARKKRQIQQTELADFIKTENDKLTQGLAHIEAAFKEDQLSNTEKRDLERALTLDIEAQVLARFDAENAGLVKGTDAYAKAMKDRQALVDSFTKHVEQQDNTLTEEQIASWKKWLSPVESGVSGLVTSLIGRTQSFAQAVRQMGLSIVEQFAQMGVKALFSWIATQLGMTSATQVAQATQVAATVQGEAAKTAAVGAGAAAQTAIKTTAAGVSNAAEAAADSKSIINSAYTAAASAYKWVMEEVPFPLNMVLAPIAAFGTFAAVAAFNVITAERGEYKVAGDGTSYSLHEREAVMPRMIADPMRDFFSDERIREFIGVGGNRFDGSLAGGLAARVPADVATSLRAFVNQARNERPIDLSGALGGNLRSSIASRITVPVGAEQVTQAVMAAAAKTGGVSGAPHIHFHGPNVTAIDSQSVGRYLRRADVRREHEKATIEAVRKGFKSR
jgi:hypothetical protein